MALLITIATRPHAEQRYDTCGDWTIGEDGSIQIGVSEMGNPKYEALVAVHELIEALLCQARGISQQAVDEFDKEFGIELRCVSGHDKCREMLPSPDCPYCEQRTDPAAGEPGDHPAAPYRKEHYFATNIERLLAAELGVDWLSYEDTVDAL